MVIVLRRLAALFGMLAFLVATPATALAERVDQKLEARGPRDTSGRNENYRAFLGSTGVARPDLSIARDRMAFDLNSQGLLLAFTLRMPAPAAATALMGNGNLTTAQGVYLSLRPNGKLRIIPHTSAGVIVGLPDTKAVVADDADHHVVIAIDGPTQTIMVFVDGRLDTVYYQSFRGAARVTSNWNIDVNGGESIGHAAVASKIAHFHALIFAKGLPGNVGQLTERLFKEPAAPLRRGDSVPRKKTIAMAIVGQSNKQGAGGPARASVNDGVPMADPRAAARSMWPGVVVPG